MDHNNVTRIHTQALALFSRALEVHVKRFGASSTDKRFQMLLLEDCYLAVEDGDDGFFDTIMGSTFSHLSDTEDYSYFTNTEEEETASGNEETIMLQQPREVSTENLSSSNSPLFNVASTVFPSQHGNTNNLASVAQSALLQAPPTSVMTHQYTAATAPGTREPKRLKPTQRLEVQRLIWQSVTSRQEEPALPNVLIQVDVAAGLPVQIQEYYERLRQERQLEGLGSKGSDGYVGDKLAEWKRQGWLTGGNKLTDAGRAHIATIGL